MPRAANDVMQSVIFSAILDAVAALKRASGGLPNQLLRDVQAIHPNVTFADLPKELQDAIAESTRAAMPSARASRCSSRGQWIGCPSATAVVRHAGRRRVIAAAVARRRAVAVAVAVEAASRAVELERVSG
jgi:hypothetical protein